VIHSIAPNAIVLVSGTDWGYDLSEVIENPVNRDNIAYEFHPYPWKGEDWKDFIPPLSQKYPVLVGEWGFGPDLSPDYNTMNYGRPLVNLCKELDIGWIAWIWHDEWKPSILTSLETYDVTEFGALVKESLQIIDNSFKSLRFPLQRF